MKSAVLFPQVVAFDNLYAAFRQARKGKRDQDEVAAFEYDLEANLLQLQDELTAGTYRPGPYRHFWIREPKLRKISAAPFRDRVVHHALCRGGGSFNNTADTRVRATETTTPRTTRTTTWGFGVWWRRTRSPGQNAEPPRRGGACQEGEREGPFLAGSSQPKRQTTLPPAVGVAPPLGQGL